MDALSFLARRCDRLLPGGYAAFFPPQPPFYRGLTVNTLRLSPDEFAALSPFETEKSPFSPANFYLKGSPAGPGLHPYHHAGAYYLQEPSASAPAALLGVQPGERVLDLCAAPGGKACQIAAALGGSGLLVANEVSVGRAAALLSNLERMGAANVVVTQASAARLGEALPGYFDRVLVDAPCSGEGMFRKSEAARAQHSQRLVESCAALQRQLLDEIAPALRGGGALVYSTCTFSPEEDETVIQQFLARHPEFVLEGTGAAFGCGGHPGCCLGPGSIDCEKLRRVYPAQGGEGQFMARLRKLQGPAPTPLAAGRAPQVKLTKEAQAFLESCFPKLPQGSFALPQGSFALPAGSFAWQGDRLWFLPQGVPAALPRGLRVLRAGVQVGRSLPGSGGRARFEPCHQFYMAYGPQSAARLALEPQDPRVAAWLRGEEIEAAGLAAGYTALTVSGLPLGFGKAGGGRLKNHYPKGLRNLK